MWVMQAQGQVQPFILNVLGEGGEKTQTSRCKINKSWDVMHSTVTIVNNAVLHIWKLLKRLDLKCSHPRKKMIKKEPPPKKPTLTFRSSCTSLSNNFLIFKNITLEPWLVWLSWLEHCSVDRKIAGSIPGQGIYQGCGFYPWSGLIERQPVNVSLSVPLSLKSISGSLGEDN